MIDIWLKCYRIRKIEALDSNTSISIHWALGLQQTNRPIGHIFQLSIELFFRDNRIDFHLLLQQSIKHGKPIPKISTENIGFATALGRRMTNEDIYKYYLVLILVFI